MKNLLFGVIIALVAVSFTSNIYAQEETNTSNKKEATEEKITEESGIVNTICPVSGEEVDTEKTFTYEGKTYAVCCNSCLKKLKADPEKYISRLSEDGKSLKKKK